jgi:hypothetical protein
MTDTEATLPFDRMKEQIDREISRVISGKQSMEESVLPRIAYEQGETRITFGLPDLTEESLFTYAGIIKRHIENVRITAFEDGHYGFQALNRNLYNTDDILGNLRFEFFRLVSSRLEISKKGELTQDETSCVAALLVQALGAEGGDPVARLTRLGSTVMISDRTLGWDYIAGYEDVKRKIRESIILPLKNPEIYDSVAKMTRKVFESNRPRALLFEGPPGVGKTTVARIIAGEVEVPLVYVPVESIMSKWYGQSSQNLAMIFDACEEMGGALIFLDEIDSLAGSRDQNLFEATRRILSVLLRKLDGMESAMNTLTIGATNRRMDLDPALISRFDQTIFFPLPEKEERAAIFSGYARHLTEENCQVLGERSGGLSGRTIKDICEMAERRWTRRLIIKKMEVEVPPFEYYKQAIRLWKREQEPSLPEQDEL